MIDRLQAGLRRAPSVILLSAPAGFGKTTLLSDWFSETMNEERETMKEEEDLHRSSFLIHRSSFSLHRSKVAWLSLDKDDNDLPRFLAYLVAALQTIAPSVGEATLAMLLASPSQPPPTDVLLAALLNDLAALGDAVFVLDDYHVIDCPPIDEALTYIVDHLPPQFRLVIASREDPPLPLARHHAAGQLADCAPRPHFTPDEAANFSTSDGPPPLGIRRRRPGSAHRRVDRRSAIGRTLHAGTRRHRLFFQAFTGSHRFVLDYLLEEVLQRQPEPVRRFLLQTSSLDRLCGPLCDAVTGTSGQQPAGYAKNLGNLFVVPLDDQRQWVRYHRLFADVLHHALARRASQSGARASPAGQCMVRTERSARRSDPACAAGQRHPARCELDRAGLAGDGCQLSIGGLAALGAAVARRGDPRSPGAVPGLCVGAAERRRTGGQRGVVARRRALDRSGARGRRAAWSWWTKPNIERCPLRSPAPARARVGAGRHSGAIRHARQALVLAAEDDVVRRTQATAVLGLAEYASGDLPAAERSLRAFQATVRQGGDMASALGITFILANIWLALGRLREAISAYRQTLRLAANEAVLPIGASDLYRGLGELLCEQGDLAAAAEHLAIAQQVGEQAALTGWPHRLAAAQARLREVQGDWEGALALLDEAERLHIREPLPDVRPIAALKARLWIRQGRWREADRWADEQGLSPDDALSYLREFEHLTVARLLIARYRSDRAEGSIRAALGLLERLRQAAEDGGRDGSLIEVLLLQALARHAQGDTPAAAALLARALALAEPEGYVRLFVDEGAEMQLLIAECRGLIERQKYGDRHKLIGYVDDTSRGFSAGGVAAIRHRKSEIENRKSKIRVGGASERTRAGRAETARHGVERAGDRRPAQRVAEHGADAH